MKRTLVQPAAILTALMARVASAHPGHDHTGLDEFHNPVGVGGHAAPQLSAWHHALGLIALSVLAYHLVYRSRRPIALRVAGGVAALAIVALWIGGR